MWASYGVELLSAAALGAAYASGELSPVEVTREALAAISEHDPVVNAFVHVDAPRALADAAASEARWRAGTPLGPADGVPTSVKDLLLTGGWPTRRGSSLVSPSSTDEDAPTVARLRAAGCVLLGKTTTPEFGWKGVTGSPRYGVTRNPHWPDMHAGGSSGGSAAAVALGMGAWSVGTDGGGSLRIPAAFTGTVTIKPTYGLVPLWPASPFGTLSHAGPMTRTVTDAALMLDILSGFDHRDWSAMPTPTGSFLDGLEDGVAGLRIAYSADLGRAGRNARHVEDLFLAAAAVFADAGATVEEVDPGFDDPVEAFHTLWFAGAAKVVSTYGGADDPGLARIAALGAAFTASDYLDATAVRVDLGARMGRFHRGYDLLLTPTVPITAFRVGSDVPPNSASEDWTSWTPYTYPFNLTQQPAASVPCGRTPGDNLPVGLQIVGARHADALVLRAARAYERAVS
ncbi:amidase [Virgisporangium ochraceum]|uniref:Amidase n=1 Tax=Virgisporangium ochraceum TaxID=65505 RepID=A0A8J3ZY91_9ACTN|nr:amidase [Virgisporangium ochraceum]